MINSFFLRIIQEYFYPKIDRKIPIFSLAEKKKTKQNKQNNILLTTLYIYICKTRVNRVIGTFPFSRVISSVKRVLVTQLELVRAKIS